MNTFTKCTEDEARMYFARANSWWEEAPNSSMFHDCKSITIKSVAEFMANWNDKTLYDIIEK